MEPYDPPSKMWTSAKGLGIVLLGAATFLGISYGASALMEPTPAGVGNAYRQY